MVAILRCVAAILRRAEPLGLRVAEEAPLGEELLRQRGRAALLHAEEEELGELVALEAERVVWHVGGR